MREEWLGWRRQGVGASDAAIIAAAAGLVKPAKWMGNPLVETEGLFWEKLNLGYPKKVNPAMRAGMNAEEGVRSSLEEQLGWIDVVNVENPDTPWVRASLDGLAGDGTIIEIKTLGDEGFEQAAAGDVPGYYRAQIAWQLCAMHAHPSKWTGDEPWLYAVTHARDGGLAVVRGWNSACSRRSTRSSRVVGTV